MLLAAVFATATTEPPCDAVCERRLAAAALARGDVRPAVERLRAAVARHPSDPVLPFWLARAYLLDNNLFWAEKSLREALGRRGESSETRLWLACVHLRQGDPELALEELTAVGEPPPGPLLTRKTLLDAYRSHLAGDEVAARTALATLDRHVRLFAEDRPVRAWLRHRLEPWWLEPASGEIELGLGHTSNALAGAPTDVGAVGTASALGELTLRSRLTPPGDWRVQPVLDLEVIGHGLQQHAYRELSSLQGAARLGASVASGSHRLLVGVRAERLWLDQSPSRYAEAVRGELEIEWSSGWVGRLGGGHRDYRDGRRTRQEWDAALGRPVRLGSRLTGVVGGTARFADASAPVYDLRGLSFAAAARLPLGHGFSTRIAATVSWDDYPHSGGRDGMFVFGTAERRRDLLGKVSVGLWLPPWRGLRTGLDWQLARRDSTADDRPGFDFDYRESRVRLLLRWTFAADPWAPKTVPTADDHVPLPWGLGAEEGGEDERIIDLLRQDEELRRGSTCGM
ncbi:MAG TPA: hypothetical protein PLP31_10120 [Thermoanaerobaculaceae bacterium]|nr:hypothetical protein [Thermoanaerobaculaceae bacterium]